MHIIVEQRGLGSSEKLRVPNDIAFFVYDYENLTVRTALCRSLPYPLRNRAVTFLTHTESALPLILYDLLTECSPGTAEHIVGIIYTILFQTIILLPFSYGWERTKLDLKPVHGTTLLLGNLSNSKSRYCLGYCTLFSS